MLLGPIASYQRLIAPWNLVRPLQQSARLHLREATADCHERVDALFSSADLASREGYGQFLVAQAAAFRAAEQALEKGGIERVLTDWPDRRRSHLIEQDLEQLGLPVPTGEQSPTLNGAAALLGGAYVLEGSRLGGKLLRRRVPPGLPAAFLSDSHPNAWRSMVAVLEERLTETIAIDQATEAARNLFALFERCGQQMTAKRKFDVA